jgi:hypothetical protein
MSLALRLLACAALGLAGGRIASEAFIDPPRAAQAADHREASLVNLDPAADINDIYGFRDPVDATQLVVLITVNPFTLPQQNALQFFSPGVKYRFLFDRNGDFKPDTTYTIRFSAPDLTPGSSTIRQQRITVNGVSLDTSGNPMLTARTTATGPADTVEPFRTNTFELDGFTCQVFAGLREDPFVFDNAQFGRFTNPNLSPPATLPRNGGNGPGVDGFANVNVSTLALRVPISALQGGTSVTKFNVWSTTDR